MGGPWRAHCGSVPLSTAVSTPTWEAIAWSRSAWTARPPRSWPGSRNTGPREWSTSWSRSKRMTSRQPCTTCGASRQQCARRFASLESDASDPSRLAIIDVLADSGRWPELLCPDRCDVDRVVEQRPARWIGRRRAEEVVRDLLGSVPAFAGCREVGCAVAPVGELAALVFAPLTHDGAHGLRIAGTAQ